MRPISATATRFLLPSRDCSISEISFDTRRKKEIIRKKCAWRRNWPLCYAASRGKFAFPDGSFSIVREGKDASRDECARKCLTNLLKSRRGSVYPRAPRSSISAESRSSAPRKKRRSELRVLGPAARVFVTLILAGTTAAAA